MHQFESPLICCDLFEKWMIQISWIDLSLKKAAVFCLLCFRERVGPIHPIPTSYRIIGLIYPFLFRTRIFQIRKGQKSNWEGRFLDLMASWPGMNFRSVHRRKNMYVWYDSRGKGDIPYFWILKGVG